MYKDVHIRMLVLAREKKKKKLETSQMSITEEMVLLQVEFNLTGKMNLSCKHTCNNIQVNNISFKDIFIHKKIETKIKEIIICMPTFIAALFIVAKK